MRKKSGFICWFVAKQVVIVMHKNCSTVASDEICVTPVTSSLVFIKFLNIPSSLSETVGEQEVALAAAV